MARSQKKNARKTKEKRKVEKKFLEWVDQSGQSVIIGVAGLIDFALFYTGAVGLWTLAFWLYREDWVALVALMPAAWHLAWQGTTLDERDPANPLARFRANRWTGLLVAAACFVVGNA